MPSALISRPSASYPTEREGGRDKRRNSPSVFLPLSFPLVAMSTSKRLEIDSASSEELSALVEKLEKQLAMVGELRLRDAKEAELVIQSVAAIAANALIDGR